MESSMLCVWWWFRFDKKYHFHLCRTIRKKIEEEGWFTTQSKLTQESEIHILSKHPRTVFGVTTKGELFIAVFSGRSKISSGADYKQICFYIKKLFPNVLHLMNVDGGASSVLGISYCKKIMELSIPCAGLHTSQGKMRELSTVFFVSENLGEK